MKTFSTAALHAQSASAEQLDVRQEQREELLESLRDAVEEAATGADGACDVDVYDCPEAVAVAALAPASEVLAVQDEVTASTAFTAARIATAASAALNATAGESDSAAEDSAVLRSDSEAALRVLSSAVAVAPGGEVGAAAVRATDLLGATLIALAEPPKAGGGDGCDAGSGGAIGSDSIALGVGTAASLRLELPIFDLTAS